MTSVRGKTILTKTSYIWPIALFPHHERSHTAAFTGREWVKDVRFGAGFARLNLTETTLSCMLIFPPLLLFEINLADISGLRVVEGKRGLLEIRFTKARLGWLATFALYGDPAIPRNRVILNVGDDWETWLQELGKLVGGNALEVGERKSGTA